MLSGASGDGAKDGQGSDADEDAPSQDASAVLRDTSLPEGVKDETPKMDSALPESVNDELPGNAVAPRMMFFAGLGL